MALAPSRQDYFDAIYIGLCPETWEATHVRASDNYLLQLSEYNAALIHLGDRILDNIESYAGNQASAVASTLIDDRDQIKLTFCKQDSVQQFVSEIDLLDFKVAIKDMARMSGQSELQVCQRIRQCGDNGQLINRNTLARQLVLLAAFGNDPQEV